jgi:hypothetical protein
VLGFFIYLFGFVRCCCGEWLIFANTQIWQMTVFSGGFGLEYFLPPKITQLFNVLEPGCGHRASQQQPPNGAPSVQITVPV